MLFGVTRRTILHDVSVLSYGYPVYTKPGEGGGIFIMDSYKPYNNTLTPVEQERLKKMYDAAEGEDKEILKTMSSKNTGRTSWNCRMFFEGNIPYRQRIFYKEI